MAGHEGDIVADGTSYSSPKEGVVGIEERCVN